MVSIPMLITFSEFLLLFLRCYVAGKSLSDGDNNNNSDYPRALHAPILKIILNCMKKEN